MSLYPRKRLRLEAQIVRENLDSEAIQIFDDLLSRLPPITFTAPLPNNVRGDSGIMFKGKNAALIVVLSPGMLEQYSMEAEDVKQQQFATFEETSRYCRGTQGLLELLVRYQCIKTEKAIISTIPDSHIYRNNRASCLPEDLVSDYYDNKRTVISSVVFKDGFAAFTFEETIK